MSKGRTPPDKPIDHAAALRDRLGSVAAAAFNPGVTWETYAEVQREQYRNVAQAVFDAITTKRRGAMGHFEVGSGYSAQRHEPYVEIAIDLSPTQLSPAKAREIALLLFECAEAAESDAVISGFARGALGLDERGVAQILDLFRQAREQRRGRTIDTA